MKLKILLPNELEDQCDWMKMNTISEISFDLLEEEYRKLILEKEEIWTILWNKNYLFWSKGILLKKNNPDLFFRCYKITSRNDYENKKAIDEITDGSGKYFIVENYSLTNNSIKISGPNSAHIRPYLNCIRIRSAPIKFQKEKTIMKLAEFIKGTDRDLCTTYNLSVSKNEALKVLKHNLNLDVCAVTDKQVKKWPLNSVPVSLISNGNGSGLFVKKDLTFE